MKKVWTPSGYQAGPMNSLVCKGESIINYSNGTGTLVTKGKEGVDNQPSSVQPNDDNVIAGNDIDWSNGMKFSDQIAPLTKKLEFYNNIPKQNKSKYNLSSLSKQTQQLQEQQINRAKEPVLKAMKDITDRQEMQHNIENKQYNTPMYSKGKSSYSFSSYTHNGKVPGWTIEASRLVPALTEATMLNHWLTNKPGSTNIYSANPYATQALSVMANNRVNPYPAVEAINSANRQGIYNINQSGGYTGGQRQNSRVAQNIGAQRNIANALLNAQEQNAKYRNSWAEAALKYGDLDAQRQQAANQYNWEAYNKAHGAKTKGIETHLANLGAMWQKYYADYIKNKQYNDVLNIYQQDVDNKKAATQALMKGAYGDNAGSTKPMQYPLWRNNLMNRNGLDFTNPFSKYIGGQSNTPSNYTQPASNPVTQPATNDLPVVNRMVVNKGTGIPDYVHHNDNLPILQYGNSNPQAYLQWLNDHPEGWLYKSPFNLNGGNNPSGILSYKFPWYFNKQPMTIDMNQIVLNRLGGYQTPKKAQVDYSPYTGFDK